MARGLIALGLTEDQIEIVDLTYLIAEHSPEFDERLTGGTSAAEPAGHEEELIEISGRKVMDEIDVPSYLVGLGVPEHAAAYYADKIKDGFAAIIATSNREHVAEAKWLVDEMKIQDPNGITNPQLP